MDKPKLFMLLLGCKPLNRNTEQHDVFFSVGFSLKDLVPEIIEFWPEAKKKIHVDAWRQITRVGTYNVDVEVKQLVSNDAGERTPKLFFINLGGYKAGEFEEYHYKLVVASENQGAAIQEAKKTSFYKHTGLPKAPSHIDDKFAIDVDDLYELEDILSLAIKEKYNIMLTPLSERVDDEVHLGYFKLDKL